MTGESCGDLDCVKSDAYDMEPAMVEWVPDDFTTYYISVQGAGFERGDFELYLFVIENVAK